MIRLKGLTIRLPGFSLEDVDLEVGRGEFFALIGPTGSGKTLLLDAIAGLIKPDAGRLWIGEREVTALPPERRGAGIVYQDYALFPHLDVLGNITYGLRYQGVERAAGLARARELSARLGIDHLLDRSVINLSGGEKQRVCLARALAVEPRVLLLDEPLSALDPNFRDEIRAMLAGLHQETGLTCLMVTHDFSEVRTLAQRVAVIGRGRIRQVGTIDDIFLRPASPFVARFVGTGNLFPAEFVTGQARLGPLRLSLNGSQATGSGHVCIRPERIRLLDGDAARPGRVNVLEARVRTWTDMGPYFRIELETLPEGAGPRLTCTLARNGDNDPPSSISRAVSGRVRLAIAPADIHVIQ